jgi:uncharacterized protein (TIGR02466 family)
MFESQINAIFPTPVYQSKLNRNFTGKELLFVNNNKNIVYNNTGNTVSKNNYVLEDKLFNNLKKELDLRVKDYFDKIISTSDNIKPYITQSWLNYTETNQYHHKHNHFNSLVSGVLYINSDEKYDAITFYKDSYQSLKPNIKKNNLFNSESWWFPVKTGDIILFPSSLLHMVSTKQGDNTRVSLAFNVFIKGDIGDEKNLTKLKIN